MGDEAARVDALVTWLGAAGTLSYLVHILRAPTRSTLERRALYLLAVLAWLLAVRGFAWLRPESRLLVTLTFAAATLLPLTMALFVEGLLRRHLPLWLKVLAAGSSVAFFLLNALGLMWTSDAVSFAFPAALLLVMLSLGGVLVARDRSSLSRAENQLVSGCLIAVLVCLPLAATDFRTHVGWPAQRWGAVGVLLFLSALSRMAHLREGGSWAWEEGPWLLAKSALLAGTVWFLAGTGGTAEPERVLPVAVAVVLLLALWERLRSLAALERGRGLLRWLANAPGSLDAFVRALHDYPLTEHHLLAGPAELAGYREDALVRLFAGSRVCSAAKLRRLRETGSAEELDAAEQMIDLLGRHEMTHACVLGTEPLRLLLVSLPEISHARDTELELEVIQRQGSLALAAGGAR